MSNILLDIMREKHYEVQLLKTRFSLSEMARAACQAPPPRDFVGAIRARAEAGERAVIAEIKQASPSKGVLREPFDPAAIARSYEQNGAACLSVLTDAPFFRGSPDHFLLARAACSLPMLRKEFIIESCQIYESRILGADCILLIAAALDAVHLASLAGLARDLGMAVMVEVHTRDELETALTLDAPLIGINNRHLGTFHTDVGVTLDLLDAIPEDRLVVTESGIARVDDVDLLHGRGVHAFLVGEAFMRAPDPGLALAELFFARETGFAPELRSSAAS